MARIAGKEKSEVGPLIRFAYSMVRRKVGRVVMPMKIHAHHPPLFRAIAFMEAVQTGKGTVPSTIKSLAQVKVATLVGCPF